MDVGRDAAGPFPGASVADCVSGRCRLWSARLHCQTVRQGDGRIDGWIDRDKMIGR